ncbi:MAG: 1-acyl-sn-glycerol-3-phosphate acyltransferase [Spartobacteria bacterium]|nr:1-acyl-sn-glycerol-3-phosphate acyltransferase [Spartobacteria bacterium]
MTGFLAAVLRTVAFLLLSLAGGVLQSLLLLATRGPLADILPKFWHRVVCRIFGLRVEILGTPVASGQTLFVANHLSYLDIPVIGSALKVSFVAKKEVASWPFFGYLARLQQTAFIDRNPRSARSGAARIQSVIAAGRSIVLFPEGTSTDGSRILPFKTSLFSVLLEGVNGQDIAVQPVTVRLEHAENQEERDRYAWYGDMDMPPHLWAFAKSRGATVRLVFHPPLGAAGFQDRKALARACQIAVAFGLEYGRPFGQSLDSTADEGTLAVQTLKRAT